MGFKLFSLELLRNQAFSFQLLPPTDMFIFDSLLGLARVCVIKAVSHSWVFLLPRAGFGKQGVRELSNLGCKLCLPQGQRYRKTLPIQLKVNSKDNRAQVSQGLGSLLW